MKIISYLNYILKFTCLVFAICILVGTSGDSQRKESKSNQNLSLDLNMMAMKVEEDRKNDYYLAKETYVGSLTGYAADCPLCSGHLACMRSLDVLHGNVTYDDEIYGNVRIVASSQNLSCGSIIRFESRVSEEPIVAIVLDRGVLGTAIDLLMVNQSDAILYVGRSTITYDVLRRGW